MTTHRIRWLPRALWLLTLVLFVAAVVLTLGDETTAAGDVPFIVMLAVGMLSFATTGTVLASRMSSNPIGWLFLAVGAGFVAGICANEYAIRSLTDLDRLPGARYAAWFGVAILPLGVLALPLALLLFPDGHLSTRRWRPVAWLLGGGTALVTLWGAFDPGTIDVAAELEVANPFGVGTDVFWRPVGVVGTVSTIARALHSHPWLRGSVARAATNVSSFGGSPLRPSSCSSRSSPSWPRESRPDRMANRRRTTSPSPSWRSPSR